MAFGGYKFKGYKVVRANLATNTYANWCLLVHQARIKAFMESCALSGAQWAFSKTSGDLSFESYGNVIYRVANANGDYHDYLSFFKYGDEELYYMISTQGEYYANSTQGTPAQEYASAFKTSWSSSQNNPGFKLAAIASTLSQNQFDDLGPFSNFPSNSLCCSEQCSGYGQSYQNTAFNETNVPGFLANSEFYVGVCTKGNDIITFFGKDANSCCIESGNGFSSLCDPDDSFGLVKINLGYTAADHMVAKDSTSSLDRHVCECLSSSGVCVGKNLSKPGSGTNYNLLAIVPPSSAFIRPGGAKVPYEAVSLSTLGKNDVNLSLNGFFVKGTIKTELLCCNCYDRNNISSMPDFGMQILGGNMIAACSVCNNINAATTLQGVSANYAISGTLCAYNGNDKMFPAAYVGWDPSNPDITDDSSWPELALS